MVGMREYPDKYFDLAVVDPVYGGVTKGEYTSSIHNGKEYIAGKKSKAKNRAYNAEIWNQPKTPPEYFGELFRVSKNQIIFGANFFTEILPPSQGWIVWDKEKPENVSFSGCEIAFTSFDQKARIFRFKWNGFMQGDMKNKEYRIHPTQKPVALYRWIYKNFAKPGDKILDTHLGSGSSRIAAYEAGLDFVGYEIDEGYYKDEEERFAAFVAQQSLFDDII